MESSEVYHTIYATLWDQIQKDTYTLQQFYKHNVDGFFEADNNNMCFN